MSIATLAPVPDEQEVFEQWLLQRSKDARDRLTPEAAKPYRYIWRSWCRWLANNHRSRQKEMPLYLQAKSAQVLAFLEQGPTPASGRVSKSSPISPITRRRYWMVLKDLYDFIKAKGWMESSPFANMGEGDIPESEKSEGIILTPQHFEAIYKTLPTGESLWDYRDRAILLLLLDAALTPGEIATLEMSEVFQDLASPGRLGLSISGKRSAQTRTVPLSKLASDALAAWLLIRPAQQKAQQIVFLTQSHLPMTRRPLFHLVSKAITAGAIASGLPVPGHVGPQVLRNTRLVLWIREGRSAAEVAALAGFKDARSLRGLRRHLPPTVRVPVDRR